MNGDQPPIDDDIEDQIYAFVLGILSEDEAARFARQLSTSPELRRRVDEAQVVTWLLAGSPPQLSPSTDLRARLLVAVEAEHQEPVPSLRPLGIHAVPARDQQSHAQSASWNRWLSAAAFLLALGLGSWNIVLHQQITGQQAHIERQQAHIERQQGDLARTQAVLDALGGAERFWTMRGVAERAPDATSVLAINSAQKQAVLIVRGLPPLPTGKTYQVWVIRNGQPVSVGSFAPSTADSEQTLVIPSDLSGVTRAAITIEPAGGSLSPTGPPVMGGDV